MAPERPSHRVSAAPQLRELRRVAQTMIEDKVGSLPVVEDGEAASHVGHQRRPLPRRKSSESLTGALASPMHPTFLT